MANPGTALWPFKNTYDPTKTLTIGPAELAYLRSLNVWWDVAENGAAGVEPPETAPSVSEADLVAEAFFCVGRLTKDSGTLRNPYAADEPHWRISDAPDPEIAALFTSGAPEIPFTVTETDRAVWAAAQKSGEGIHPKRPFGSENPGRDLRPIIDPDKTLKGRAYTAARNTAEARMLLFMQFFVDHAELAEGEYIRGRDYIWRPAAEAPEGGPEPLTHDQWAERIRDHAGKQCDDYAKTGAAVERLVFEARLMGPYAKLAAELDPANLHRDYITGTYDAPALEMIETGLAAFDESALPLEERVLTLFRLRVLNASAAFDAAWDLVTAHGFDQLHGGDCSIWPLSEEAVVFLNTAIAAYGAGQIDKKQFDWRGFSSIRGTASFSYDILRGGGRWREGCPPDLSYSRWRRARAMAAQLRIMHYDASAKQE